MEVQSQSQPTNQNMSSLVSRSKLKTPKSRGSVAFQGTVCAFITNHNCDYLPAQNSWPLFVLQKVAIYWP